MIDTQALMPSIEHDLANGHLNGARDDNHEARGTNVARREHIEIALEIDRLIERCEGASLPFVAYLLRVARAAMSENLGERVRR